MTNDMPGVSAKPPASGDELWFEEEVRPTELDDFIGQDKIRKQLSIWAHRSKTVSGDHLLVSGLAGMGKTALALATLSEMYSVQDPTGVISWRDWSRAGDVASFLINTEPNRVLIFDEINLISSAAMDALCQAMERFQIDIQIGEGERVRTVSVDTQEFTVIGLTTHPNSLPSQFRDRFKIAFELDLYSMDELQRIVIRSARLLNLDITEKDALEIARLSHGTPRIANRLLRHKYCAPRNAQHEPNGAATASTDGSAQARDNLILLVSRFGKSVADDPRRLNGLLKDLCGEHFKREVNALVSVAREGIVRDLANCQSNIPIKVYIQRGARRLIDNVGLVEDLAVWSVETWVIALNKDTHSATGGRAADASAKSFVTKGGGEDQHLKSATHSTTGGRATDAPAKPPIDVEYSRDEDQFLIRKRSPDTAGATQSTSLLKVMAHEVAVLFQSQEAGAKKEFLEGPVELRIPSNIDVYIVNLAKIYDSFECANVEVPDPMADNSPARVWVGGGYTFNIVDYKDFLLLHRCLPLELCQFSKQTQGFIRKYVIGVVVNAPTNYKFPGVIIEDLYREVLPSLSEDLKQRVRKAFKEDFGVNLLEFSIDSVKVSNITGAALMMPPPPDTRMEAGHRLDENGNIVFPDGSTLTQAEYVQHMRD